MSERYSVGRARAAGAALAFFFYLFIGAMPVYADSVPGRETAGVEESRFREEQEFSKKSETAERPTPAPEVKSKEVSTGETNGKRFLVKSVRFLGNRSIDSDELHPLTTHLENRDVTLAEIQEAVSNIKQLYRDRGYVAAYVFVPPQELPDGVLKIDVLEGRFGRLKVSETKWFSGERIRRPFRLKPGDVVTYEALRRDLTRLNKHRDLKAKAVLEPGEQTGLSDVALQVEERFPFHVTLDAANSGTKNTGKERYGVTASHSNLFGRMDEISATTQLGEHSTAVGGSYSLPILPEYGTSLGYSLAYAEVDIAGDFAALDAEGDAFTQGGYIKQPFLETPSWEGALKAGLDAKDIENRLLGGVAGKDKLRIPYFNVDFEESDKSGKTLLGNGFYFGVADFLGSSEKNDPDASRLGTGGDFFAYRGYLLRFQKIHELLASLKIIGQASSDSLPPSEQMRLGGARSIRGYPEGDYMGDRGIYGSLDLYIPAFFLPSTWAEPFSGEPLQSKIQMIAFADLGTASLNDPLAGEFKNKDLASVGAGFRVHLFEKFYARLEWGFPVGDRPFDSSSSAFHFTISYEVM